MRKQNPVRLYPEEPSLTDRLMNWISYNKQLILLVFIVFTACFIAGLILCNADLFRAEHFYNYKI